MLDLNKIKEVITNDIETLLHSLEIEYESISDNIFSKCPIHEGSDNNRALSICKHDLKWKCWTRGCEKELKNDIFGLVQGVLQNKTDKEVKFIDAVNYVCKLYKINKKHTGSIKHEQPTNEEEYDNFNDIIKIFTQRKKEEAVSTVEIDLGWVNTWKISEYFIKRGFREDTLKHFEIKECFDRNLQLFNRAIIPVHSYEGVNIGYIARSTKDYILPKYLFSKGFKKSNYLYNYHKAIKPALEKSCLFILEGQGDVWKMYEAGVNNCVSIFGKTLSETQRDKLLSSGITNLVVLTDNDQAGRESKVQLQRQLNRTFTVKYPKMNKKDVGEMKIEDIQKIILSDLKGLY